MVTQGKWSERLQASNNLKLTVMEFKVKLLKRDPNIDLSIWYCAQTLELDVCLEGNCLLTTFNPGFALDAFYRYANPTGLEPDFYTFPVNGYNN